MSGIRVSNIPIGTTEKDLKIHFSNPKHGGKKISRIYYPLPGNEAVLNFQDDSVSAQSFKDALVLKGKRITVKALPQMVFSKVTVEIDPSVTQLLDENSSYLDELQFDGDLEVTFDPDSMNYIMSGDWYQVEWALAYLDNICNGTQTLEWDASPSSSDEDVTLEKSQPMSRDRPLSKRDEKRSTEEVALPVEFKSSPESNIKYGHDKISKDILKEDADNWRQEIPAIPSITKDNIMGAKYSEKKSPMMKERRKQEFGDDFTKTYTPLSSEYNPEIENLFTGKNNSGNKFPTTSGTNRDPFALDQEYQQICGARSPRNDIASGQLSNFHDDDNWFDPSRVGLADRRPYSRYRPKRQQGMTVSHSDFEDIPMTLELTVETARVLVTLGDLIEETTDAIVNPCSSDLSNAYGISKAIAIAAGTELQEECRKHVSKKGPLLFGDVIHTCAGGRLNKSVGFVLHAAGPVWRDDQREQSAHMLTCTYLNCLQYANKQLWLRSLSLPLISAGAYGCPLDESVQAFYDALLIHVTGNDQSRHLKEIHLVSNDADSTCAMIVVLRSLMDLDQEQSKSAAFERYQTRCMQYEFTAKQFTPDSLGADVDHKEAEGGRTVKPELEVEVKTEDEIKEKTEMEIRDKESDNEDRTSEENGSESDHTEKREDNIDGELSDQDSSFANNNDKADEERHSDGQTSGLDTLEKYNEETSLGDGDFGKREFDGDLSKKTLEDVPSKYNYEDDDDDDVPMGLIDVSNMKMSGNSDSESEVTDDNKDKHADVDEESKIDIEQKQQLPENGETKHLVEMTTEKPELEELAVKDPDITEKSEN